jgi:hypothetical protein
MQAMQAMMDTPGTMREWRFDPPAEVLESRIFAHGGYFLVSGLFDQATLQSLLAEAEAARTEGVRQYLSESDGIDGRGGSPARSFRSGRGGELHWGLHGSPEMKASLATLCGVTTTPTGSGSYSYYEQPGDFLALHRDILQCDLTVITCLKAHRSELASGELTIYPNLIREPLSVVRTAGRQAGSAVALEPGQSVIILGGLVPHEMTPTSEGQERIVAINCFRIETGDAVRETAAEPALELACR